MTGSRSSVSGLVVAVIVGLAADASACGWRRCGRRAPAPTTCVATRVQASHVPTYATPQAVPQAVPSVGMAPHDGSIAAAVALINAARGGRAPLAWDAGLASWAAANRGVHGVLAPGAGQCQAWGCDAITAARQWLASPAHYAILMSATQSIGIGPSEGGWTANVR